MENILLPRVQRQRLTVTDDEYRDRLRNVDVLAGVLPVLLLHR